MNARTLAVAAVAGFLSVAPLWAHAEPYRLVIKNHRFEPAELTIPADQKVKLIVENQDSTPEEFESYDLNREKVIPGNAKAVIYVGPLKPGRYKFVGEFHEDAAHGVLVVK